MSRKIDSSQSYIDKDFIPNLVMSDAVTYWTVSWIIPYFLSSYSIYTGSYNNDTVILPDHISYNKWYIKYTMYMYCLYNEWYRNHKGLYNDNTVNNIVITKDCIMIP